MADRPCGWRRIILMGLVTIGYGAPLWAAPCTATNGAELVDLLTTLDDGMGGTIASCLNVSGRHEIIVTGVVEIDAPLVVDLGNPVELRGPGTVRPAAMFDSCSEGACATCGVVIKKWSHVIHDLTIEDFPVGGLCVEGTGHVITYTTLTNNSGDGIHLGGAQNSAVWNTINGTHGDGIALYGETNMTLQNTIGGYDHYGLGIYPSEMVPDVAAAILASNTILAGAADGRCSNWEPCVVQGPVAAATWLARTPQRLDPPPLPANVGRRDTDHGPFPFAITNDLAGDDAVPDDATPVDPPPMAGCSLIVFDQSNY